MAGSQRLRAWQALLETCPGSGVSAIDGACMYCGQAIKTWATGNVVNIMTTHSHRWNLAPEDEDEDGPMDDEWISRAYERQAGPNPLRAG